MALFPINAKQAGYVGLFQAPEFLHAGGCCNQFLHQRQLFIHAVSALTVHSDLLNGRAIKAIIQSGYGGLYPGCIVLFVFSIDNSGRGFIVAG